MQKVKEIFSKNSSNSGQSSTSQAAADHNPTSDTGIRSTAGDTGLGSKGAETTTTRGNAGGIAGVGVGAGGLGGPGQGLQNTTGRESSGADITHTGHGHAGQHGLHESHTHDRADIVPMEGETTTSDHKHLAAVTSRFLVSNAFADTGHGLILLLVALIRGESTPA